MVMVKFEGEGNYLWLRIDDKIEGYF